jgi:starch phosphorylase
MAKNIIKLISNVASVINADPDADERLKVVFLPNYRVSTMEVICPGADLSEQISTAGKEASGTGNMKFMMNGAITIGTLDGANIEILQEVGAENFFLFGLSAEQVAETRRDYCPWDIIAADKDLNGVMELLKSGHFNQFEKNLFNGIIHSITRADDPWLTAADFRSFVDTQELVASAYRDQERWTRMSILNTANSGKFSTDRTMLEYSSEIWHLSPVMPHTR